MNIRRLVESLKQSVGLKSSPRPRRRLREEQVVQTLEVRLLPAAVVGPQIDLAPTRVDAPTDSVTRGAPWQVMTAVQNSGSSASGDFQVSYYLSADANITTSDILLTTVTRGGIAANSSQQWWQDITIPETQAYGNFYVGVIVDPSNRIAETSESNNSAAEVATVRVHDMLELSLWEVNAPDQAQRGTTIDVWTGLRAIPFVNGMTATGSYTVNYYLSADSTITTSDRLLKSVVKTTTTGNGKWNESVTLPSDIAAGTYTIGAIVDPNNAIWEAYETNNVMADTATIAITLPPQIDLTPTVLDAPANSVAGNYINVATTVRNLGSSASGEYFVSYYLSTDATITTSDTLLSQTVRTSIAANGTQSWTESIQTPLTLPTGDYYIGFIVDAVGLKAETNEGNNTRADAIRLTTPVDLQVLKTWGPETIQPGGTWSMPANFYVNAFYPTGPFEVRYYLSTDRNITTSDILLKSVTHPGVDGNAMWTGSEMVTFPTGLAYGDYYVGVWVDPRNLIAETIESNNIVVSDNVVSVRPSIDFDPWAVSGPSAANRGSTISVYTDIDNLGMTASGNYTVSYYLSTNSTISTSDILLKTVTRSSISPRTWQQWYESVVLPASLATGEYYLGVIVDPQNAINETNESNNAQASSATINVTSPIQIDLDPFSIDAPATAVRGTTISVATDIENKGTTASGSYTVNYYLSADATITTGDTLLKSVTRTSIAGQSRQQWAESIALSSGLAAGNYYIGVIVDPSNAIGETNESNNAQADGTPIAITAPILIDLDPFRIDAPTTGVRGSNISVATDIDNLGSAGSGTYTVNYYLSTDALITTGDTLLKSVSRTSIAGQSRQSWTESIPLSQLLITGTYYLGVVVDPANGISETNETNNAQVDATQIIISAPTLAGFQIQLNLHGTWTASQISLFQQAARRWEEIIVGDLPDMTYEGQIVDDLLIDATAEPIDGVSNTLANAGPDWVRTSTRIPLHGTMRFDTADMATLEADGRLFGTMLHEMGHVLGIGTIWEEKGLLAGKDTAAPTFTGARATAEYNAIFGTNATAVPVQGNDMGPGSRNSHWRESILDHELMTPLVEAAGVAMPISRITAASLADLGYTVNMSAAGAYTRPGALRMSANISAASLSSFTLASSFVTATQDDANDRNVGQQTVRQQVGLGGAGSSIAVGSSPDLGDFVIAMTSENRTFSAARAAISFAGNGEQNGTVAELLQNVFVGLTPVRL